ncbi:MAG TPA: POTRA domain-containing protein, partial [bacterium]|nr:POTRA domain-containing protein [bacterium]
MRIFVGRTAIAIIAALAFFLLPVPGATQPQDARHSGAGQVGSGFWVRPVAVAPSPLPAWYRTAQAPPEPAPPPGTPPPPSPPPTPTTPPPQPPTPAQPPAPAPVPTPAPPSQPPQHVVAIEVRGNKHVPTEQILPVIQTKVGDESNDEKIRADVRAILDLGMFADVNARLERMEGGVRLVFIVIENPIVSEIIVEGNTVVSTEEIQTALGVPVGQILNFTTMRAGARAVEKLYESKGYVLARVTDLSIIPTEAGGGRLRVKVGEGFIEAIRFEGLTKTKEIVVRRQLKVKQGDVFNI